MSDAMPRVEGVECDLPFSKECIARIEYYDGELTSLYRGNGERFIVTWVDADDRSHRWCAVRVSRGRILSFSRGEVHLADVFRSPEDGCAFFIDADGPNVHRCVRVEADAFDADDFAGEVPFPMAEWHEMLPEEML